MELVEKTIRKCLSPLEDKISAMFIAMQRLETKINTMQGSVANNGQVVKPNCSQEKPIADRPGTSDLKPTYNKQRLAGKSSPLATITGRPQPISSRSQRADARQMRSSQTTAGVNAQTPSTGEALPKKQTRASTPALSNPQCSELKVEPTKILPTQAQNTRTTDANTEHSLIDDANTQPDMTTTDQKWQIVRPKKHQQRRRNIILGTGQADDELKTVERVKKLHACFFQPETTNEMICNYMTKKNKSDSYIVEKIGLKHNHYASFAITVPASKFDYFMASNNWPPSTEVSEWFHAGARRASRAPRRISTATASEPNAYAPTD